MGYIAVRRLSCFRQGEVGTSNRYDQKRLQHEYGRTEAGRLRRRKLAYSAPGARRNQKSEYGTTERIRDRSMKQPQDYPRRILVAVTGLSPQIVTETLYALSVEECPPFIPTEIRLITTSEGAQGVKLSLLHKESGWFHRLLADYGLPSIEFGTEHIHVLEDEEGQPLGDIRRPQDNARTADLITDVIRRLTRDPDSALHVSIAGGRKTMGFYLGYALSLYGRAQDRLSHVLVSAPYESNRDFFYPTPKSEVIHTSPDGRPLDAHAAEVTLAAIPFVRLREGLPEGLLDGDARFSEVVAAAQHAVGPAELVIDLAGRRVRAGGRTIALRPPVQLAFLAWLTRRQKQGEDWIGCPSDGAPEPDHAEAFLREYHAIIGEMGDDERTKSRLRDGMTSEFFSQTKSRLHESLKKALGRQAAGPYLIARTGGRSQRRYGLELVSHAIRFEAIDPEVGSGGQAPTLPGRERG